MALSGNRVKSREDEQGAIYTLVLLTRIGKKLHLIYAHLSATGSPSKQPISGKIQCSSNFRSTSGISNATDST